MASIEPTWSFAAIQRDAAQRKLRFWKRMVYLAIVLQAVAIGGTIHWLRT